MISRVRSPDTSSRRVSTAAAPRARHRTSPYGATPQGVDTEGVNGGPGQPKVETWLTRDVPDWTAQHFRVKAQRNAWATIGYSAGGYVAAMATVLHSAQYGAGIVLGGYFRPNFGPF